MIPPRFLAAVTWLELQIEEHGHLHPALDEYARVAETIAAHDHDDTVPAQKWTRLGWVYADGPYAGQPSEIPVRVLIYDGPIELRYHYQDDD